VWLWSVQLAAVGTSSHGKRCVDIAVLRLLAQARKLGGTARTACAPEEGRRHQVLVCAGVWVSLVRWWCVPGV
jgi:hypothetical protein